MNNINLAVTEGTLMINVVGNIGGSIFSQGFSLETLIEEIKNNTFNKICLNIASLGGDAYEGISIYNALESYKNSGIEIETNFTGLCASAATIIGMAGKKRCMMENSLFLIHPTRSSIESAKVEELQQAVEQAIKLNECICNIYCTVTGLDSKTINKIMCNEEWLTAEEALEYGFVTEIIKTNSKIENKYILEINNSCILPTLKNKLEIKMISEIKNALNIQVDDTEVLNEIVNIIKLKDDQLIESENKITEVTNKFNEISANYNELIVKTKLNEIDQIISDAISKNKITNELKENYKDLLLSNFDSTKKLLDKMLPIRNNSIMNTIESDENSTEQYPSLSFTEISQKDPDYLKTIYHYNFELFNKIYSKEFKKDYLK